jgi:hypothetical protein
MDMTVSSRHSVTVMALAMVLAAALLAVVLAKPAWADDTQCDGALPPGIYDNVVVPPDVSCVVVGAQVRGNVTVSEGALLQIIESTIGGNVKALPDSVFIGIEDTIRGNVEGDLAGVVQIVSPNPEAPDVVGGNIQIKGGRFIRICGQTLPEGNIEVTRSEPFDGPDGPFDNVVAIGDEGRCQTLGGGNILDKGGIKVEENNVTGDLGVDQNRVGGNLQVFKNRGTGTKTVQDNTVLGNLQCFENTPPFVGGPNAAQKAEGQCF